YDAAQFVGILNEPDPLPCRAVSLLDVTRKPTRIEQLGPRPDDPGRRVRESQLGKDASEVRLALQPIQRGEIRNRQPDRNLEPVPGAGKQVNLVVDGQDGVVVTGGEPIVQKINISRWVGSEPRAAETLAHVPAVARQAEPGAGVAHVDDDAERG